MSSNLLDKLPERIKRRIKVQPNGCWYWTGSIDRSGYGRIQFEGKSRVAHRVVRYLTRKDIPLKISSSTVLDHEPHCGTRKCVNPFHTDATTTRNNLISSKHLSGVTARSQQCQRGHDLSDPENVYVHNGKRSCKVCRDFRFRIYHDNEKIAVEA